MFLGMQGFDFAQSNQIYPNLITFTQMSLQFCPNLITFTQICLNFAQCRRQTIQSKGAKS